MRHLIDQFSKCNFIPAADWWIAVTCKSYGYILAYRSIECWTKRKELKLEVELNGDHDLLTSDLILALLVPYLPNFIKNEWEKRLEIVIERNGLKLILSA
jgi:hypothetical protein